MNTDRPAVKRRLAVPNLPCGCGGERCRIPAGDPRHGTANGYHNLLCRCRPCRDAWAARCAAKPYQEDYRRRQGHMTMDEWRAASESRHGTESRYTERGCRCDLCRLAANTARNLRRIEMTHGYRQPDRHGTHSTYSSGCRCDDCRAAHTAYCQERRARARDLFADDDVCDP